MPQSELGAQARATVKRRRAWLFTSISLLALAGVAVWTLSHAGSFLVVDDPQPSDAIVILEAAVDTPGYNRALNLRREGYAGKVLLNAGVSRAIFGRTEADLAKDFLNRTGQHSVYLCPVMGITLFDEVADVRRCLQQIGATSAILMTSDFETRRTLSIFQKRLPQYRWSVAAASTPYHFAEAYWKYRGWAKTVLQEWEDFLWWKLVAQWRADVVLR